MKIEDILDAGYGFRLLQVGDERKLGDEQIKYGGWSGVCSIGFSICNDSIPCRRKIDPGEGFELVPEGETVKEGDEFLTKEGPSWYPISAGFGERVVKQGMKNYSGNIDILVIRRRKPAPAPVSAAMEEKKEWICLGGDYDLVTEKEARAKCKDVSFGFQRFLARAVSKFENVKTEELKETPL